MEGDTDSHRCENRDIQCKWGYIRSVLGEVSEYG